MVYEGFGKLSAFGEKFPKTAFTAPAVWKKKLRIVRQASENSAYHSCDVLERDFEK
jgi:hypothetical protein